ncbi:MAG: hypothetical protein GYA47_09325 [Desulfovibrio sp.]|nr:hypothetical protein [Desulfovibrio sp.]
MEQCEALLTRLVDLLREDERPALRERIETAMAEYTGKDGENGPEALRFLQDLDIFVNMPGPDFMYSRGIAETLRVGEEIFELAYFMKRALR